MPRLLIALVLPALTACATPSVRSTVVWPPPDLRRLEAQAPKSVGAELEDPLTLAVGFERWAYVTGRAIEGLGARAPADVGDVSARNDLVRAHAAERTAALRLEVLMRLTCGAERLAREQDCVGFMPPDWVAGAEADTVPPDAEALMTRSIWFEENASAFTRPACEAGARRTDDARLCDAD